MSRLSAVSCSASKSLPLRWVTVKMVFRLGREGRALDALPPWVRLPFHCESTGRGSSSARSGSAAHAANTTATATASRNNQRFSRTVFALRRCESRPEW